MNKYRDIFEKRYEALSQISETCTDMKAKAMMEAHDDMETALIAAASVYSTDNPPVEIVLAIFEQMSKAKLSQTPDSLKKRSPE